MRIAACAGGGGAICRRHHQAESYTHFSLEVVLVRRCHERAGRVEKGSRVGTAQWRSPRKSMRPSLDQPIPLSTRPCRAPFGPCAFHNDARLSDTSPRRRPGRRRRRYFQACRGGEHSHLAGGFGPAEARTVVRGACLFSWVAAARASRRKRGPKVSCSNAVCCSSEVGAATLRRMAPSASISEHRPPQSMTTAQQRGSFAVLFSCEVSGFSGLCLCSRDFGLRGRCRIDS